VTSQISFSEPIYGSFNIDSIVSFEECIIQLFNKETSSATGIFFFFYVNNQLLTFLAHGQQYFQSFGDYRILKRYCLSAGDRTSWTTSTDSGCYSSSSGERSPSASLAQVYLPSSIAEHPPYHPRDNIPGQNSYGPQYATPYAVSNTRTRCMSESATALAHRRSDSETSSQSSYSGNGEIPAAGGLISSDSGYFSYGGYYHRSNPESIQENSGGWTPQQKVKAAYNRSQSISGRPTAAQQAQLAALASRAARSRSAPMPPERKSSVVPPCSERRTSPSDPELNKGDEPDQGGVIEEEEGEQLSFLQKQIRQQRQLIQAKAKGKEQS